MTINLLVIILSEHNNLMVIMLFVMIPKSMGISNLILMAITFTPFYVHLCLLFQDAVLPFAFHLEVLISSTNPAGLLVRPPVYLTRLLTGPIKTKMLTRQ